MLNMFKGLKKKIENQKAESNLELDHEMDESLISESLNQLSSNLIQFTSQDSNHPSSLNVSAHQSLLESENHRLRLENTALQRKMEDLRLKLEENLQDKKEKEEINVKNKRLKNLLNRLEEDLREKKEEILKLKAKCDSGINEQDELGNEKLNHMLTKIAELEKSILEKNKRIRLQQQRISDIKKSFHKDLLFEEKDNFEVNNGSDSFSNIASSSDTSPRFVHKKLKIDGKQMSYLNNSSVLIGSEMTNDINFQYLRNVVFKFLICSDYEAQKHLIKAISVLLKFTKSEEKQARESLNYRMSWLNNFSLLGNKVKSLSNLNN